MNTIPTLFRETAKKFGDKVALRHKKFGLWDDVTWSQYYEQSKIVGQALIELGMKKGDFVAIIGNNSPEWVMIDMGVQMVGGVSVGIYSTNAWQQVQYIVNHAGCKFLFAEDEEQVDKWLLMRENTPTLEKVFYWEEKGLRDLDAREVDLMDFNELLKMGAAANVEHPQRIEDHINAVQPEDIAFLIYTSGTTGPPKGAMLSQSNLVWTGQMVKNQDPGNTVREDDEVMSFLPLCHIFERLFSVIVQLTMGYTVNFVEGPDTVPQNLREISPTIGYAVPRIWEKYHSRIIIGIDDAQPIKRFVFKMALKIGLAHANNKLDGKKSSFGLKAANFIAQKTVFHYLKMRLGMERMRMALSGAAPISPAPASLPGRPGPSLRMPRVHRA